MDALFQDVRSAVRRLAGQRGFTLAALVTLALGIRAAGRRFQESLLDELARLADLSGVAEIGLASRLPLAQGGAATSTFRVAGAPPPADRRELPRGLINPVSPGYFDVMGMRLRSGRDFTRLDGAAGPRVLVINETLARDLFGGEPAVGRRLRLDAPEEPWEVIGVVADLHYSGLLTNPAPPEAFTSVHQLELGRVLFPNTMVAVRTAGDPLAFVPFLREAVPAASPRAVLVDVMTMDARVSAAVAQPRFYAVFVGFFAALALFLAAFGVYALLSYTVSQRRREIGVRMALGARRGDVLALVVRQGAGLVAAGTLLGLLAAAGSARLLESFLFGVAAGDRLTFVGAPLVLAGVALVACWLPGRRAARLDPMDALRVE